jgi:hypothetical protein
MPGYSTALPATHSACLPLHHVGLAGRISHTPGQQTCRLYVQVGLTRPERVSSDWVPSRLHSASSRPWSTLNGLKTPMTLIPHSPAWEVVPAAATIIPTLHPMALPLLLAPAMATAMMLMFWKKQLMHYLMQVHLHAQHHHHYQHYHRPCSWSTHTHHVHASPTPVFPMQFSNSHDCTLFIGPISCSVRQGAHSLHLHEVHCIHHPLEQLLAWGVVGANGNDNSQ